MTYNAQTYSLYLCFILIFSACQKETINACPYASGTVDHKTISLAEFKAIHLYLEAEVNIHPAPSYSIQFKGDQQLLNQITTVVENNTLKIENQYPDCNALNSLKIDIGLPHLNQLLTTRKNKIQLQAFPSMEDWTVNLTDKTTLEFVSGENLRKIDAKLSRGAQIICRNQEAVAIEKLNLKILGKGNFDGFALEAQTVDIQVNGGGLSKVSAKEKLDVVIYGDAKVICKGSPHFYKRITGSGNVRFTN